MARSAAWSRQWRYLWVCLSRRLHLLSYSEMLSVSYLVYYYWSLQMICSLHCWKKRGGCKVAVQKLYFVINSVGITNVSEIIYFGSLRFVGMRCFQGWDRPMFHRLGSNSCMSSWLLVYLHLSGPSWVSRDAVYPARMNTSFTNSFRSFFFAFLAGSGLSLEIGLAPTLYCCLHYHYLMSLFGT